MEMDVGGASVSDGEGCSEPHTGQVCGLPSSVNCSGKLKRSSSAPMINQLVPNMPISAPPTPSPSSRDSLLNEMCLGQNRVRRLSATFGPVSPLSPGSSRASGRMRVCQLREEEGMDVVNREAAHERTVHSCIQVAESLSQSCEDLTVTEDRRQLTQNSMMPKKDYGELSLMITPSIGMQGNSHSVASPTRAWKQCFSPSLQQPVRNALFSPTPSPTKKSFSRRSLSPIPLRPSPLGSGLKRKWDSEGHSQEAFITPNKRLSTCAGDRCGGLLIAHTQSIGSLENSPSPAGGGSVGSIGTPDSVCSSGSPGPPPPSYSPAPTPESSPHLFKPVSPALASSLSSGFCSGREQSDMFGTKSTSSLGEGSDASSDAMITEDTPPPSMQALKAYQEMDLSETLTQGTLNI